MIAAEFQLTSDDYAEAHASHLANVLGKKLTLATFVLGAALLVTLFITLTDPAARLETLPAWIFLGAMLLLVVLLRSKALYRMQFNKLKALHEPIHFEVGNGGVVFRNRRGETTINWVGLEKWRESKTTFLLYPQQRLFFVVPKRALDADQVVALRELLGSHVQ
jgi:hypothetical protein